jgi:large subunit ribosomal protein L4
MMEIQVHDLSGKVVETIEFDETCLGKAVYKTLLHQAIVSYEANRRVGTASTKNRREVTGAKAKPWRQKGLGRARAGQKRSPIWRGGGSVFGPKPRDFSKKLSKKSRRAALKSALLAKLRDGEVKVITGFSPGSPRTKDAAASLKALGTGKSCMMVLKERNENAWKSVRNIPNVKMAALRELNAYDALSCKDILITKDALNAIPEEMK